jgi:hypothetical protein
MEMMGNSPILLNTFVHMEYRFINASLFFLICFFGLGAISPLASQTWKWGRMAQGSPEGYDACMFGQNNIYYTGCFNGSISFGPYSLSDPTARFSTFLAKYDSTGQVLWASQTLGTTSTSQCISSSVEVDTAGNILATGYFSGTIRYGTSVLNATYGAFLAKYNSSGNVLWAVQSQVPGLGDAYANDVATDISGNSIVTGEFSDTVSFGSNQLYAINATTNEGFLTNVTRMGIFSGLNRLTYCIRMVGHTGWQWRQTT